ncbi:MAG: DNA methyltransferase [Pacificimonas sp.]
MLRMTPDEFIDKWAHCGGNERANYAQFLNDLIGVLGLADTPGAAQADGTLGDYQFEGPVAGGSAKGNKGFIDLYKRGHFVLEAKQSQLTVEQAAQPDLLEPDANAPRTAAGATYDRLMNEAYAQAKRYAVNLPSDHPWPSFIIVLDVGRAFEIYFDFAGNGRGYRYFPDRKSYRIAIEDLRDAETRKRLTAIWTDPRSIDPRLVTVEATRKVARELARVSQRLEEEQGFAKGDAVQRSVGIEETSLFLMRILFCMFAEDIGLLPKGSFTAFLERTRTDDEQFKRGLLDLWDNMGRANLSERWTFALNEQVRYFNGSLFSEPQYFRIVQELRGNLILAAKQSWTNVEPAIFGTLLEQALTPEQRSKLGAHYTPRAYVEMIVHWTIMDVLTPEWEAVQAEIEPIGARERLGKLRAFHDRLAAVRVLDPACGTGNFLYVAMEALLALEAKVIETIEALGGAARSRIGPAQFYGLEKNPRAAKIAELVLWIGWLRWQHGNDPDSIEEPVLGQKANINFGQPGGYDAVLAQDETGAPDLENPRQPDWPEAEFIVGNPPFIGGKDIRAELGGDYAEALWAGNPNVPKSADFVMQWWDRAADLLRGPGSPLCRFGFVTTNSVTQEFSRRVIAQHLTAETPLALVMACADHPWTKATKDAAAVRIAMTVAERGERDGTLLEVEHEGALDTDKPDVDLAEAMGAVSSRLSLGADPSSAARLKSNFGLASRGVQLIGSGFIVTPSEAEQLGLQTREGLADHIRPYRNGRDLLQRSRGVMVIDLFGLSDREVRQRFPEVYQHLIAHVKPDRDKNRRKTYRENWWIHGEPRGDLRPALENLSRYIVTVETAKHRIFQFLPIEILPDNKLTCLATEDAMHLGVLSSRVHQAWYLANAGMIGMYQEKAVWVKATCWEPFPFPDATPDQRQEIGDLAEELDATRRQVLDEPVDLLGKPSNFTMTEIYNWRERIAAGEELTGADHERATAARAWIIDDLHKKIDAAVARAYGWETGLAPAEIVARLVALNAERAAEEAEGKVRWLRPDYQIPRFGE